MTTSNLADALATVGSDIELADGEITVILTGPAAVDCGPNPHGQLLVEIVDEEPFQYCVDLDGLPPDSPQAFLAWLHEHGVATEEAEEQAVHRDAEQLTITVTFDADRWQPSPSRRE